jgi:hypothetical protein
MEKKAETRRRVKVYELDAENNWEDKGTGHVSCTNIAVSTVFYFLSLFGFCESIFPEIITNLYNLQKNEEYHVVVKSEKDPEVLLLEAPVCKEDIYELQQGLSPSLFFSPKTISLSLHLFLYEIDQLMMNRFPYRLE